LTELFDKTVKLGKNSLHPYPAKKANASGGSVNWLDNGLNNPITAPINAPNATRIKCRIGELCENVVLLIVSVATAAQASDIDGGLDL
jgi:hypothetical protein